MSEGSDCGIGIGDWASGDEKVKLEVEKGESSTRLRLSVIVGGSECRVKMICVEFVGARFWWVAMYRMYNVECCMGFGGWSGADARCDDGIGDG